MCMPWKCSCAGYYCLGHDRVLLYACNLATRHCDITIYRWSIVILSKHVYTCILISTNPVTGGNAKNVTTMVKCEKAHVVCIHKDGTIIVNIYNTCLPIVCL